MNKYCFLNNEIIIQDNAFISVRDIGILRGYGIFEVLRTYNLQPFLFKEHLDRFTNSAKLLGLKIPLNKDQIFKIIIDLISKNHKEDCIIRMVLTGGYTENSINFDYNKPTFFITTETLHSLSDNIYKNGIKLKLVEHQRIVPEAKTTNYIFPINLKKSLSNEFFDLLYFSKGCILESSTSNFFIIKNDKIITPKNNILMGTIRNFVIDMIKYDYQIEERDVLLEELESVQEAFLTATNKNIIPVVGVDNKIIGDGIVGKETIKIMNLYKNKTENYGL